MKGGFTRNYPAGGRKFPRRRIFARDGINSRALRITLNPVMSTATVSSAFESAMLPHLDAAYNLARWLMRNEHDARDCVQDA